MNAKPPLLEWLQERMENCRRIGQTKFGAERRGWAEDEAYFRQAIEQLSRISDTEKSYSGLYQALWNARRAMIVQVTGLSDGLTIHDIRKWIEQADTALAKAEQP